MGIIPNLLNTGNVTDWSHTFDLCGLLMHQGQYMLTLDTSSATNMSYMFRDCCAIGTLSELDCTNVTNVSNMFDRCSVVDFGGCKNLGMAFTQGQRLDLSTCGMNLASIHNVLTKLGNTSYPSTVAVHSSIYNDIDPADIASANAKGWSVVSA